MVIKYVGFEDQNLIVRLPAQRQLVIKLKPSVKVLHDIVIEGNHYQEHSLSQALGILTDEQIETLKGRPLGEMIQAVPGVQSIMTGAAIFKPMIHGLYGQRVAILNNGLRQEGQQWGIEHAPEIDTYIASEIEVVKGTESVRFGADALGGAVIINAKPLHYFKSIGVDLSTGFSTNNRAATFSGMLEGGFTNSSWGWRVQGTLKRGGDYHAPTYNLSNTGVKEYDFSGTLGYRKGKKELEIYASSFNTQIGILRSAHSGSLSDLQESVTSKEPWYIRPFTYEINNPYQDIGHHLFKISGRIEAGKSWTVKAAYGFQMNARKEFDVRRGDQNVPSLSMDIYAHTLDVSADHEHGNWTGSIGVSTTLKDNYNVGRVSLLPDYRQKIIGLFAIEKYRKNNWLWEAGLRLDRQMLTAWLYDQGQALVTDFNFTYISASLGTSLHIKPQSRFSSNLAMAVRPPHVSELYSQGLHHSAASIEKGLLITDSGVNADQSMIRNERSTQWVNTFQFSDSKTSLEVNAYVNYFNNYVFLSPAGTSLTIRGYFPVFQYRQTDALLTGTDVAFSYNISSSVSLSTKFSYVMIRDLEEGNKLPFIPPAQWENGITYKVPGFAKWKNFYVTVAAQTMFKQTHAPQAIQPDQVAHASQSDTFDFMEAPPGYTLIRIESGIKLPLDNHDITISLIGENLMNKSYRNYLNRLRYYADETGRNFSLRLNYTFHKH